MLAQVALPLCVAFILIALRQDIKEARNLSSSLWIPVIWLTITASKSISYWIYPRLILAAPPAGSDYMTGNPLDRAFFIILICLGLGILIKRKINFYFSFKENTWLFAFYLYALISASWSDYSGISIKRWVKFIGDLIIVMIIMTDDRQKEAIEHVFRRCAIILLPLSVYFVKYFRVVGVYYDQTGAVMSWRGVSDNKNGLGLLCAFFGIYLVWRVSKGWPEPKRIYLDAFLLILTLYLLRGSRSATSTVVFIVGVMIMAIKSRLANSTRKFNRVILTVLLLVLFTQIFLTGFAGESLSSIFFSATGRNSSFTGRVPLWGELIKIGIHKPFLGAGYGAFWLSNWTRYLWGRFDWRPLNAHNGYIDVFMDLGMIGLIILLILVINTYRKVTSSFTISSDINRLLLVFFIMIVFHNFSESTIARGTSFLWFIFLLTTIAIEKNALSPRSVS